jgi:hypothetical protein
VQSRWEVGGAVVVVGCVLRSWVEVFPFSIVSVGVSWANVVHFRFAWPQVPAKWLTGQPLPVEHVSSDSRVSLYQDGATTRSTQLAHSQV